MRNFDKELKNLSFRLGSEITNIAKEKTAPIVTGRLKRDIKARNATASGVTITQTKPYRMLNMCMAAPRHT